MKHKEKVEEMIPQIPGKLVIKEFSTGRASIHTVESHIRKCIDHDIKPDLVLIDYVDLLASQRKNVDRKFEIDDIYTSTKGLARELNIPIWYPAKNAAPKAVVSKVFDLITLISKISDKNCVNQLFETIPPSTLIIFGFKPSFFMALKRSLV